MLGQATSTKEVLVPACIDGIPNCVDAYRALELFQGGLVNKLYLVKYLWQAANGVVAIKPHGAHVGARANGGAGIAIARGLKEAGEKNSPRLAFARHALFGDHEISQLQIPGKCPRRR